MLTADLVTLRRRDGVLTVAPLSSAQRERARALLETYHRVARLHVGLCRGQLEDAMAAVDVAPRDRKLALALAKLVEDQLEFELPDGVEPAELRAALFAAASRARLAGGFDRPTLIAGFAAERGLSVDQLERALYADLRDAHVLVAVRPMTAAAIVERFPILQAQAVLQRAVRVTARVTSRGGAALRRLFHKLKFLRLLHEIQREDGDGESVRIELDGPFSLFEPSTRYGLRLALALPALAECERWSIDAEVRWGKARAQARFSMDGAGLGLSEPGEPVRLADDVQGLLDRLREADTPWRVRQATAVLDLPGVGVCAPDLVFTHPGTGARVYLEVMGHWSRQAVWRRVELVRAGLRERILFAVGQHLRVSEAVLDGDLPGAIYVYKRTMSPRGVLERVEALGATAGLAPA
jgi:uncharacterized protein